MATWAKLFGRFCQVSFCIIAVTWLGANKPTIEVIQLHIKHIQSTDKNKQRRHYRILDQSLTGYEQGTNTFC